MKHLHLLKSAGAVAAIALASAPLHAQPTQESKWYAGVAVGQAEYDACSGVAIGCDDNDTAWKLFGGYQFNPAWGAELAYVDLGNASASAPGISATADAKGLELVGVGTLPIGPRFAAYGKAGVFYWEADTSATVAVPGFTTVAGSRSDDGTDFTYGVGLRYDFTRNLSGRLEWQRYNNVGEGGTTGESDIDLLALGIAVKF